MGNAREAAMYKWLESNKAQCEKGYTAYLKAAVNVDHFVDAGSLDNFWEWCMSNQPETV